MTSTAILFWLLDALANRKINKCVTKHYDVRFNASEAENS